MKKLILLSLFILAVSIQCFAVDFYIQTFGVTCNGGSDGTGKASAETGTPPYTYLWSNGDTISEAFKNLPAGNHWLKVTDAASDTLVKNFTISEPTAIINSTVVTSVSCYGFSDGAIDITPSGGDGGPYTYSWSVSSTVEDISSLAAGIYTITTSDVSGCKGISSITVTEPQYLSISNSSTNLNCNGGNNGLIDITPSGGDGGPYTHAWNNGAITEDVTNLFAGTYCVTTMDGGGCKDTTCITITEPLILSGSGVGTNLTCNGINDGSISITPSGGTAAYTYMWSNGATTQSVNSLAAGTYTATITDAAGCKSAVSTTITEPTALLINTGFISSTCGIADGSASATGVNGNPGYYYTWTNGATTQTINNIIAGSYGVTVTDNNGCKAFASIFITDAGGPAVGISTSTNVSCNGGNDGSLTVTVNGGAFPITYKWSNGATTSIINGLIAGTHTCTVTDNNGCKVIASATITDPMALLIDTSFISSTCGNANGSVSATGNGGTPGYSYKWSTGSTTQSISSLAAGNYMVTVTDNNGCKAFTSISINDAAGPIIGISNQTNVSCNGGSDGSLTITANGGTPPLTYDWSIGTTSASVNGLIAGTYTCTVTDNNGCKSVASGTITQRGISTANLIISPNDTCTGDSVIFTVFGSDLHTSYFLDYGDGLQEYFFMSFADTTAGFVEFIHFYATTANYTVTLIVEDTICGYSDTLWQAFNVYDCYGLSIKDKQNASCYGKNDGSMRASAHVGPAQSYAWLNASGAVIGVDSTIIGLSAGTYTVSIIDAAFTEYKRLITITEPNQLITGVIIPLACGSADESISLNVSGGIQPYSYNWSTGETSADISSLAGGTYSFTVTDNNGCSIDSAIVILDIVGPSGGIFSQTDVSCNGFSDGGATITVTGGTPPIIYKWSSGETSASVTNLSAGVRVVSVIDNNNCKWFSSVTITEPSSLNIGGPTVSEAKCYGEASGWASIDGASGGIKPYTYRWSHGDTDSLAENISAGTYIASVIDANGCMDKTTIPVGEKSEIINYASITNILCNGSNDGSIAVSTSGGVNLGGGKYNYAWSNGVTNSTALSIITGLSIGTFWVTVTDFFNCTKIDSFQINDTSDVLNIDVSITDVSCNGGADGIVLVNAIGGITPYSYSWNSGSTSNIIAGVSAGTYILTLTDNASCVYVDTVDVFEPDSGCGRSAIISGNVFHDIGPNCAFDTADFGFDNWIVVASPGPVYGITTDGYYELRLDTGTYNITSINGNELWKSSCVTDYDVTIGGVNDTITDKDFPYVVDINCQLLSVDMAVNSFRRCATFRYFIYYCNNGNEPVDSTYIKFNVDPAFTPIKSHPINYDKIQDSYYFSVGSLDTGECGNIWVRVQSSCDLLLGETRCATAEIFPYNKNCIFPQADTTIWDKSSVMVEGWCIDDSIAHFVIINTGDNGDGDMADVSELRVFVNNILAIVDTFSIAGGDSLVIEFPANGNTIRLEADQRTGHPGNSRPRATIENCGTDSLGNVDFGYYTSVPQDDADPYIEEFCTEIIGSFDPNDKMVWPTGMYSENYISTTDNPLEYRIRFQNTGNDTAIHIQVRDTLPNTVDITTLEIGASSHEFVFDLYGNGIMVWQFDSIMLPDSNVNEEASHGFVKFKINQKAGLAEKTKIENSASIYFDINDPVLTNTSIVTVFDTVVVDTTILFPYFCDKPVALIDTWIQPSPSNYVTFFNVSTNADSYFWDFGDGNTDTSSYTTVSHTYANLGTYKVCLTVTNKCGSDSMCKTISFTDGMEDKTNALNMHVYPNPNTGEFVIEFESSNNQNITVELTNITGKVIFSESLSNQSNTYKKEFSINGYAKGVYSLKVVSDGGVVTRKVVYR